MNQKDEYKAYEEDYKDMSEKVIDKDSEHENEKETFYNDGEDKKPKIVLMIIGIVVLLIILLIVLLACSNKEDTKVSTYLKTLTIPDTTITPTFDKKTFEYEVSSKKDSVIIRCEAENKKATVSGCNKQIHISEVCKKHIVKVKAKGAETQEYTLNLCKKNEDVPIIKEIKITPETYTNSSVKVIVEAESSINLHTKPYSFDEGKTWQESNEYEVTENQVLNIRVRNEEGNGTSETLEITNIDKTQPKVTVDGSVNSGTTTTSNVELTSEVNPTTTVSDYKYQWYKDNKKIEGATKSTYLATTTGNYKVTVTTGSGNAATSNTYKVVKKTSSGGNSYTLTITSVSGNPSSWTKGNVTLKVNATTSNGLHDTAYSFDGGKTFQNSNTKQFTKNQEVNIVVRDKKNNKTTYKVKITKIDKTAPNIPKITLSSTQESVNPVYATIQPGNDALSGVKGIEYSFDGDSWIKYTSQILVLNTTGVRIIYARTIDKVGNVSTTARAVAKCDKDQVVVGRETSNSDSNGVWFQLNFKQKYAGLTGITSQKYEYVYWNATKTTHTVNSEANLVGTKCGIVPPPDATIRITTNAKTIKLYQKYNNQYNCFAVRPYRPNEISGLNRWTVQWKLAVTKLSVNPNSYNGN